MHVKSFSAGSDTHKALKKIEIDFCIVIILLLHENGI